jgi:hypothetical protein
VAKNAAAKTHDFERAAVLHHEQTTLEAAHEARYERLLRESVPPKPVRPRAPSHGAAGLALGDGSSE